MTVLGVIDMEVKQAGMNACALHIMCAMLEISIWFIKKVCIFLFHGSNIYIYYIRIK